jgi:osmotically-inducible protein OsmY
MSMPTPEELLKQIRALFEHDQRVELHHSRIHAAIEADGTVVLEGEVPTVAAKKTALRLASSVSGMAAIIDRLTVSVAEHMGDGAIRDGVRDALLGEPAFANLMIVTQEDDAAAEIRSGARPFISISVEHGRVTLNGRVGSLSHRRLAGLLAWWIPGTRDVINGMEVSPPQEDSDDELTEAVRLVLDKDPLVTASRISVKTANSIVTLEGVVANQTEREMAEADAWFVLGVEEVTNRLQLL